MAKGGFRGMPGGGMNQAAMMKQAQKMQQEMLRMQAEQEAKTFTAKSGGGMVSATVNGKHELVGMEINPEAVDPDDVEMLQDMVMAAVNEAMRTADAEAAQNMSRLTGGMNQMQMMKQAQKLQQEMLRMQEEQENATYSAKAGGGVVTATVNGKHEVLDLKIDPEAVDPDDVEMLQDMIIAAVNEAMRTADAEAAQNMSRLTGGMNLGGLF